MFAPFALTPIAISPTRQDIPANVPNIHYCPDFVFRADRLTDWFDTKDSANIAVIHLQGRLPEGAVTVKVYSEEECPEGVVTKTFEVTAPSYPTVPMRPIA